eukprot:CAMPEP_0118711890 /NCGR_PEP_ID=MMETSP0800-20121206/24413_1 /TAXON_ID=210618 ORGANISM="Striatella unipunctata, Strain CCMP2910" /NCGR_SAMPLE_ID=MMETSP0800 /ASSEMBLY_ACC=CAM_ASM_000638 /LENGTH=192 /DNA_ID=CAMNT_0006616683 /DNA_START=240 /DNA_END=818 /DNA_ORIENTATION=+
MRFGMEDGDLYGSTIALSSNGVRIVVGAKGYLQILDYVATGKRLVNRGIIQLQSDVVPEVQLSGNGVMIAVLETIEKGWLLRTFRLEDEIWVQVGGDIDEKTLVGRTQTSIAISFDGQTLAHGDSSEDEGRVKILELDEVNGWQYIVSNLEGDTPGDEFGASIALSANGYRLYVGAPGYLNGTGQVCMFEFR